VGRYDAAEALQELTEETGQYLGLPGVGITVADHEGRLRFATARDDSTTRLERAQEHTGSGPCNEAYRNGRITTSGDLRHERRWPEFTRLALEEGMVAVAGIPMDLDGRRLGALDIDDSSSRQCTEEVLSAARVF